MSKFNHLFGRVIREQRESRGFTISGLAALAKLHHTQIQRIETGESGASCERGYKICRVMGLTINDIIEKMLVSASKSMEELTKRECNNCQKDITVSHRAARYCSIECRYAWRNRKRRIQRNDT